MNSSTPSAVLGWDDRFAAGAAYACDHADRLIVDLRNNGGGYVSRGQRLVRYLKAAAPAVPTQCTDSAGSRARRH